jgi:catechol 2,3-dioxygenase-like lactoylglutathione lyase family enzyme
MAETTLPGLRSLEHVGLTVPRLDEAVDFFTSVFGAREVYRTHRAGPPALMRTAFEVAPELTFTVAMLRLPTGLHLELFEWSSAEVARSPGAADAGAYHLGFRVDSVDAAIAHLRQRPEVRFLGDVNEAAVDGPTAGSRWLYAETSWGLRIELVERPTPLLPA